VCGITSQLTHIKEVESVWMDNTNVRDIFKGSKFALSCSLKSAFLIKVPKCFAARRNKVNENRLPILNLVLTHVKNCDRKF